MTLSSSWRRSLGLPALAFLVTSGLVVGQTVAPAVAEPTDAVNPASVSAPSAPADGEVDPQAVDQLADGFEILFTEVVRETPDGSWVADYDAARRYGVSEDNARQLALMMTTANLAEHNAVIRGQDRDLESFAKCVVSQVVGFPISPQDLAAIGKLLKAKRFHAAIEKLFQVAALNGATALLEFGIKSAGGPVAFAALLALYAGSCALSEQMPDE